MRLTGPASDLTTLGIQAAKPRLLDEALVIFGQGPKTYTGEDILELHLHGGTAIVQSVLSSVGALHQPELGINVRYAEHGEFLKRAFLNGRVDLTTLEGVREMIDAETESQRVAALSSMTGDTRRVFSKWRDTIVHNVALLTTVIDFGEDHDLDEVAELFAVVDRNMHVLAHEIDEYLHRVTRSAILLRGVKLALLGPPNAGKSSLLNRLANHESAIVSDMAGTTRDVLDVPLDIGGYKVVVGDTAGVRDLESASDPVEREGIRRAKLKSLSVDLVLVVLPLDQPVDATIVEHLKALQAEGKRILVVLNKEDLLSLEHRSTFLEQYAASMNLPQSSFHVVSCTSGTGLADLTHALTSTFKELSLTESSDPITISARAQDLLRHDVLQGISQFHMWKEADDVVLAAESLRQAVEGIGKITGEAVGIEEVLGVVFSSFCIGK